MSRPRLVVASDFLNPFAVLSKPVQEECRRWLAKLRVDPMCFDRELVQPDDVLDGKVRFLEIGQQVLVIVRSRDGVITLVVWVGSPKDVSRWVRRKRFEVNPKTGTLQTYEIPDDVPEVAHGLIPSGRLLSGVGDDALSRAGVPEELIPAVFAVRTLLDLDELAPYLPSDAADALYLLASGVSVDEVMEEIDSPPSVDTDDVVAALERPASSRQFQPVTDDQDLAEMLNAPLEQWRVFLHPSQRKLVNVRANGPYRVLGGAGTGKTVVLMHRCRHLIQSGFLSETDGPRRILVTTFTNNLAVDLRVQLESLCGTAAMERVDVVNIHQWATDYMKSKGHPCRMMPDKQRRERMELAVAAEDRLELPTRFYFEEWDQVVQGQGIDTIQRYLGARRVGRGTRLSRKQRAQVWPVFEEYRRSLNQSGWVERTDLVSEACLSLQRHPEERRYAAVLADEVQDFGPAELRLLRAMVAVGPNDLFLVGDAHQRIYGWPVTFGQCGIEIRGRARRLRVNYRTTEQVRRWAVALLEGLSIDDLDGGTDTLQGYRSLRFGLEPTIRHFDDLKAETRDLVKQVREWLADYQPNEICVAARTNRQLAEEYGSALREAGIEVSITDTEMVSPRAGGVRLSTMHRMKGLEYPCVALVGVQQGTMPYFTHDYALVDELSRAEAERRERCLLYVSATRARDELLVTGHGMPSPWLSAQGVLL